MTPQSYPNFPESSKFAKTVIMTVSICTTRKLCWARAVPPKPKPLTGNSKFRYLPIPPLPHSNRNRLRSIICALRISNTPKNTILTIFFGIKTAVEILLRHCTGQAVDTLDTRHFLFLQDMFVQHNVSRRYCNMLMKYIRAMLKWGILRKLVPHQVYVEAQFIPALKKGKTRAYEKPPRQDVPDEVINRTLPYLLPTLRDMVQVQRLASMRPSTAIPKT